MNNFIKESGKLYSIYNDNTLEDLEQKYLDQFYRIMSFENELTSSKYNMLFSDYINAGGLVVDDNHYKLLLNLFNHAEKVIEVVSPWITSTIIDNDFIDNLKKIISTNKKYKIIFCYNKTQYTLNTSEEIEKIINRDSMWKNKLKEDIEMTNELKVY